MKSLSNENNHWKNFGKMMEIYGREKQLKKIRFWKNWYVWDIYMGVFPILRQSQEYISYSCCLTLRDTVYHIVPMIDGIFASLKYDELVPKNQKMQFFTLCFFLFDYTASVTMDD